MIAFLKFIIIFYFIINYIVYIYMVFTIVACCIRQNVVKI